MARCSSEHHPMAVVDVSNEVTYREGMNER